ncbi:hypothetical protein [Nocardia sp. CC216A]|uniref:hypothetical protein n=1 Tax=unclassified Nocardia TaxID=2637762 RepID=UPI0035586E01
MPRTVYDVDVLGLNRLDRAALGALVRNVNGGPVGVSTLARRRGTPTRQARRHVREG